MTSDSRRRAIRYLAALLSAGAALVYLLIGFDGIKIVDEAPATGGDLLPFGLLSGAAFGLGAILLVVSDRRVLWILGGLFQVFVIGMYFVVAPQREPAFEPWGIGLKVVQVVLLAALAYLALRQPRSAPHVTAMRRIGR
jgi:hypothetical protein